MTGSKITLSRAGRLIVPKNPIIPFIEGDGTGPDIWRAAVRVFDAAVAKAFAGEKSVVWHEILAGEKAFNQTGSWLPTETLDAAREYVVSIKGPLTTPVGGGIRSLNVALRQELDLYTCVRPVRWFRGVPSPVKEPNLVDMCIFRENTEDIYAGIEFQAGSDDANKFAALMSENFPDRFKKVRFPASSSFGIKPVSQEGTERLMRAAIEHAIKLKRKSITIVHKGNIMKSTEGGFRDWSYETAAKHFGATPIDGGPWHLIKLDNGHQIVVKDVIADAFLQQILLRPAEYDVIATLNLNGDYVSDALAAQVGGIGIAPGANINYRTGSAVFEATHGTAPKYANLDKVNPSSLILSGVMMFDYMGWGKVSKLITKGLEKAIRSKRVTYDFARLMKGATELKCSEFADGIIKNM